MGYPTPFVSSRLPASVFYSLGSGEMPSPPCLIRPKCEGHRLQVSKSRYLLVSARLLSLFFLYNPPRWASVVWHLSASLLEWASIVCERVAHSSYVLQYSKLFGPSALVRVLEFCCESFLGELPSPSLKEPESRVSWRVLHPNHTKIVSMPIPGLWAGL